MVNQNVIKVLSKVLVHKSFHAFRLLLNVMKCCEIIILGRELFTLFVWHQIQLF